MFSIFCEAHDLADPGLSGLARERRLTTLATDIQIATLPIMCERINSCPPPRLSNVGSLGWLNHGFDGAVPSQRHSFTRSAEQRSASDEPAERCGRSGGYDNDI